MDKQNLEKIFIEYLDKHQGIIFKIARIYAPTPDEKEDLIQDILLQAWRSFRTFKNESKFSTWLYRVALNTALTATRFYKKKKLEVNDDFILENQISEKGQNQQEEVEMLYAAIRKLKPVEKGIILLYLEEKSYKEISEIMGITSSNVSVRIVRIKGRLHEMLSTKIEG